jgi:glycosyltransferase involved in cell wall biosynthesis
MKILWASNVPWTGTGYGVQTALFTPRFKEAGHDVAISATWGLGGSPQAWHGIPVFPADDQWGNVTLPRLAQHWGGDDECLVIFLGDVWPLHAPQLGELNMAAWTPVDHDPIPPQVNAAFDELIRRPIAMSRFGEQQFKDRGRDPLYVPHGIETGTYRPKPEQRSKMREAMGIPDDAFVVGMVAANKGSRPPRKAFPQVFEAFAQFRKDHPDAYLYLHSEMSGKHDGIDLRALAIACEIPPESIKHTPPWWLELEVKPDDMANIYSTFDVLASPSYGEGFGVPIIEAQSCGVPVIVTDFTAMTELCGAGWLVDGDRWWDGTQQSWFKCASVSSVYNAIGLAYEARHDEALRIKARAFGLEYDADRVMRDYWTPVLDELAPKEAEAPAGPEVFVRRPNPMPKEPPPGFALSERRPNRAERRAQKKAA